MIARDQAPAAFTAWDELIHAVASTTPKDVRDQARALARSSLDPTVPPAARSDAVAFAEQMVLDVASMPLEVRAAGLAALDAGAPGFVLAVWTEDMMLRTATAWRELFGEEWLPSPTSTDTDPWVAHEHFLMDVAKLTALDPVTSELVRLRGARAHDCRLCQSRRSVSAIDAAGRSDVFDDADPSAITEAQGLALQVVDAFVWQPLRWPPELGARVVDALGPAAATELTLDIVRNAANKIAVAFAVDDPRVEEGVEYYDIDLSTGELRYDVRPVTPGAGTASARVPGNEDVTNPYVQSMAGNFDVALRLLEAALTDCPDELWETDLWPDEAPTGPTPQGGLHGSAPWFLGYHALLTLDYDLTAEFEPWEPPPPFDENTFAFPNRAFTKAELLGYLDYCRGGVSRTLDGFTATAAARPLPDSHRYRGTLYAVLVGGIPLHVVEHAAQIRQFLTAAGVSVRAMPGDRDYAG